MYAIFTLPRYQFGTYQIIDNIMHCSTLCTYLRQSGTLHFELSESRVRSEHKMSCQQAQVWQVVCLCLRSFPENIKNTWNSGKFSTKSCMRTRNLTFVKVSECCRRKRYKNIGKIVHLVIHSLSWIHLLALFLIVSNVSSSSCWSNGIPCLLSCQF